MLSGLRYLRDSIFSKTTVIDIYIDHMTEVNTHYPEPLAIDFHDNDECCMQALIDSFSMHEASTSEAGDSKPNVSFKLKDPGSIKLRYYRDHVLIQDAEKYLSPDFVMAKCAAESILRILFTAKVFQNERVLFTARKNQWETNFKCITSDLVIQPTTMLEPNIENDKLAYVFGHLDINEIRIYFNDITADEQAKIESTLAQKFTDNRPSLLTQIVIE